MGPSSDDGHQISGSGFRAGIPEERAICRPWVGQIQAGWLAVDVDLGEAGLSSSRLCLITSALVCWFAALKVPVSVAGRV